MTFPKMSRGHSLDLQSRGYVLHLLGIKSPLCFYKIRTNVHVRKDDIWRRIRRFSSQSSAVILEQSMGG
jgi:hypothetical protein